MTILDEGSIFATDDCPTTSPAMSIATRDSAWSHAEALLTLLAETGDVTFQTFGERETARNDKKLAKVVHGDIARWEQYLRGLNAAGAGVFFMVNQGDGQGRADANVIRVRALFVDLDGSPVAPVLNAGLEPHAVVESSPGRWHIFWLVADCPLDQFKPMQQALAAKFGGDPSVCDLPRVMRLPGFMHQKGEPFMTRLISLHSRLPYTLDEIRSTLDLQPPTSQSAPPHATVEPVEITDRLLAGLRSALKAIPADDRHVWVRIGQALKTLGEPGFGLWWEWSQTSNNHQPEHDRKTWRSFKPTRTSHKVVFAVAAEHGWINPASKTEAPAGNVIPISAVERARRLVEAHDLLNGPVGEAPAPEPAPAPLPEVGRCPASQFAALVDWIENAYGLDVRAATAVAIAFTASLAARRYSEPTHLYTVVCGPRDACSHVARVAKAMLSVTGDDDLVRDQRIGTMAALYETLGVKPSRIYITTELVTQALTSRRQPAGTFEHLWEYMADSLLDERKIRLDNAKEAGRRESGSFTIEMPALSMLASVQADAIEPLFNAKSSARTLIKSALWIEAGDLSFDADRPAPADQQIPGWIVERAKAIAPYAPYTGAAPDDCFKDINGNIKAGRVHAFETDARAKMPGGETTSMATRRNARRVAAAIAAWESPVDPQITGELAAWVTRLLERSVAELAERTAIQENEDGRRSVYAKVLEAIKRAGKDGLRKSRVQVDVRDFRNLNLDRRAEILEALMHDEAVVSREGPRGGSILYLAAYAPPLARAKTGTSGTGR